MTSTATTSSPARSLPRSSADRVVRAGRAEEVRDEPTQSVGTVPVPESGLWARPSRFTLRWALLTIVVGTIAVSATWRAWVDIFELADLNGDNSHVYLAPLVILWLYWVRRGRLPYVRVTGRWTGPPIIALGWVMSMVGLSQNFAAAFHAGAMLIVVGAIVSAGGKQVVTRFLPAASAALFMIPVPQLIRRELAIPLQTTTAWIVDAVLDMGGIESRLAGNTLIVNGRSITIAEACNGMPMVFGLLLVTWAFAFAWPMRNSVRWLLLLLSPVVTLGCNVLRTVPLVWTYGTRSREAADWLHAYSGWVMLPVAFVVLLLAIRVLRWLDVPIERYRLASP